jgi:hypothetical protein
MPIQALTYSTHDGRFASCGNTELVPHPLEFFAPTLSTHPSRRKGGGISSGRCRRDEGIEMRSTHAEKIFVSDATAFA